MGHTFNASTKRSLDVNNAAQVCRIWKVDNNHAVGSRPPSRPMYRFSSQGCLPLATASTWGHWLLEIGPGTQALEKGGGSFV